MTGCAEGRLHLDMEFGIVEIEVQEETDDFVRGLCSSQGSAMTATPFIRYRVGDVRHAVQACLPLRPTRGRLPGCGWARRGLHRDTRDGRWVGRLDHIFKDQQDIGEAQIVQGDASSIQVRMVVRPSFDGQARKNLLKEIHSRLGTEIRRRTSSR